MNESQRTLEDSVHNVPKPKKRWRVVVLWFVTIILIVGYALALPRAEKTSRQPCAAAGVCLSGQSCKVDSKDVEALSEGMLNQRVPTFTYVLRVGASGYCTADSGLGYYIGANGITERTKDGRIIIESLFLDSFESPREVIVRLAFLVCLVLLCIGGYVKMIRALIRRHRAGKNSETLGMQKCYRKEAVHAALYATAILVVVVGLLNI